MTTRRKLLSLLLIAVLSFVCVLAVSCGEEEPEVPQKTEWPEAGTYYFEAATDEYTLTLNVGDTFALYVKGESLSGSYTLTDKSLVLDFTKDGVENATATYDGDVISLTYGGAAMRMLKKVSYTVSFNTDGGSAVSAQTVLNGKTAAKPADPTREGYIFVGWYKDADFKTPFAFGAAPVTADTTVFAQWSKETLDNREYTARLDGNYDGASVDEVLTIGGKLFDLPAPERTGYTFGGWWFSDDNDGAKLSYKYESGMELGGNVTLYALWQEQTTGTKLQAPVVNVTAGVVSWNSVAGARSYLVKVINEDGEVVIDDTVGATTYNVPFASLDAGKYEIRVTALANSGEANNAECVRYYTNKALGKVSGFTVIGDSMLVFNTVEGAEKYLVTVVCANAEHDHESFDNGTSRTFSFANCEAAKDGISFVVTAVAEGYASSTSEPFVYKRELAAVEGLRFDAATETLSWNEVDKAESYMVSVTCGNAAHNHEFVNFGSQNFVSLKECAPCEGGIVVKVYPKTTGFVSPEPAEYVFNKTALKAPSELLVNGTVLSWSEDSEAQSFEVMINGTTYTAQTNSFDIAEAVTLVDEAEYTVSVRAVGATSSVWSDTVTTVYYEMGDSVVYSKGTLSWAPVIGAQYYEITVNDGEIVKVEGGAFSAPVTLTKAGTNSIKVRFVDGSYRSDWTETTVFAHSVILDTRGGSEAVAQYLAVGDPITLPSPEKAGYEFLAWYNLPGGAKDNGLAYSDDLFNENGSIVLYAYYRANEYEIIYNYGAGGSGTLTTDKVSYESNYQLTVPTASDVAGAFGGWFSAPYGMGVQYTDEQGFSLTPWTNLEGKELYAFWIDKTLEFTLTQVNGKDAYAVSAGERINLVSEVTVPATFKGLPVAFVSGNAFANCTNLKVINLPETIAQISGISPFAGCTSLEAVNVYDVDGVAAPAFASVDGVLFATDMNGNVAKLQFMPIGKTGTYRIPNGITEIPAEAFKGSAISKVVIPATVVSIGREAFDGCINLAAVTFAAAEANQAEAPLVIGQRAFRGCTALEKITLPARLTDIKLKRYGIYDGVVSTSDVENAFAGCYNLKAINVAANNKLYKSADGVLYSKDGKTLVLAPDSLESEFIVPEGTQAIAPGAFIGTANLVSVTFPGTLTLVGECAFYGLGTLTTVNLSANSFNDLTVDRYAFANCASLTAFNAPTGSRLAVISDYAFTGTGFSAFTFPKTVTSVGVGAFSECADLASVAFEDGGKELAFGADAFKSCTKLETVYIPANVSQIPGVFSGCTSLKSVEVAEDSPYFTSDEGVVYDADKTYIVFFPQSKTGTYEIPDTVTTIPNGTFRSVTRLDKLVIPASVTSIGSEAFSWANIDEIEFAGTPAEGAELVIGESAFERAKIGTVAFPAHTVSIGYHAFYYAEVESLTLNEGLRTIEDYAFEYAVMDVTVPASVEYIGAHAFGGNMSFNQYFPNVTLTVEGSKLKTIGDYAFYGNPNVTDIVIPASVETIGNFAYAYCDYAVSLTFAPESNLKTIGGGAFYGQYSYDTWNYPLRNAEIVIPKSVTSIGARAFYYTGIASVIFEDGGSEDLVIGTSVAYETYGGTAFYTGETFANCNYLATVVLPARLAELRNRTFYYSGYNVSALSVTFGEGEVRLATIGEQCFAGAKLKSFEIPASVRNLAPAVDSVTGLTYDRLGIGASAFSTYHLTAITFAQGGTEPLTLGNSAFDGAYIESIELPARLSTYNSSTGEVIPALANGARVFNACRYLTEITVEESDSAYLVSYDGVLMTADMTEIILCPASKEGTFEIPATVTKIYERAFYECKKLTAITFAQGTAPITIGDSAFAYCSAITEMTLPDNVAHLGQTLFYGCSELVTLTLPAGITSFDGSMVTSCSKLAAINVGTDGSGDYYSSVDGVLYNADKTELVIYPRAKTATELVLDASVKVILANAFANNSTIERVTLPEGLVEIKSRAFYNCTSLASINVPSTVQLIDKEAFYACYSLGTLTFAQEGNDPLIISDGAFKETIALTSVAFPARLYVLGDEAFYAGYEETSNLSSVTFADGCQLISIGDYAFEGASIESIVIPAGVATIGDRAFFANASLVSFVANEGLVSIGDNAFAGCSELLSVSFPASLKTIGASLFYLEDWNDAYSCPKLASVTFAKGSQLEYLPAGTFAYTALQSFVVPASVQGMGDGEYYDSENPGVFTNVTTLESVTFESGSLCANIGASAFEGCTALHTVEIPTSVATIGEYAFAGCTALEAVTIPETVVNLGAYMFSNCSSLSEVELKTKATVLPSNMFVNCSALTEVVIPASVSEIGSGCFGGTSIEAFTVDEASTYFTVIEGTLYTKDGTQIIAFPPMMPPIVTFTVPNTLTTISESLFEGMESLTTVIFEEGRTGGLVIEPYAFYDCVNLVSIELPEGTTSIGSYAFGYCEKLMSFTIPSTVKEIGSRAFSSCYGIIEVCNKSSLTISTSYGELGYYAWNVYNPATGQSYLTVTEDGFVLYDDSVTFHYSGCVTLMGYIGDEVNITLPENFGFINEYAFAGRDDLVSVIIPRTACTTFPDCIWNMGFYGIGYGAFEGCDDLYVFIQAPASYEFEDADGCIFSWEYDLDMASALNDVREVVYGYRGSEYRLRFDTDGVWDTSYSDESYEQIIYATLPTALPEAPEREGYIFGGWYTSASYTGNPIQPGYMTYGNMSYYAKYYTEEEWLTLKAGESIDNPYAAVSGEKKAFDVVNGGDKFWFVVTVEAGETWNVTTEYKSGGSDHRMWYYDAEGNLLLDYDRGTAENYDYTFTEAGTYYIAVGFYGSSTTGSIYATLTQVTE